MMAGAKYFLSTDLNPLIESKYQAILRLLVPNLIPLIG